MDTPMTYFKSAPDTEVCYGIYVEIAGGMLYNTFTAPDYMESWPEEEIIDQLDNLARLSLRTDETYHIIKSTLHRETLKSGTAKPKLTWEWDPYGES